MLLTYGGVKEYNLAAELLAQPPDEYFGATLGRRVVTAMSDITVSSQAKLKLAERNECVTRIHSMGVLMSWRGPWDYYGPRVCVV